MLLSFCIFPFLWLGTFDMDLTFWIKLWLEIAIDHGVAMCSILHGFLPTTYTTARSFLKHLFRRGRGVECKVSHGLEVKLYPIGTILLDIVTEQPEQSIYKAEEKRRLHVVPLCGSLRVFVHFLGFFLFLLNWYILLKQNFCSYCPFSYLTRFFWSFNLGEVIHPWNRTVWFSLDHRKWLRWTSRRWVYVIS